MKGKCRRSLVEPTLSHLERENRLGRCFLAGLTGDAINAVVAFSGLTHRLVDVSADGRVCSCWREVESDGVGRPRAWRGCRRRTIMDEAACEFVETLTRCFADLEDPRVQASCDHLLIDILAMTILGVSCGADEWTDLETSGRLRHDWLRTFLELPAGIPSHDTFRRVLGLLDRQQFAACLFQWTQASSTKRPVGSCWPLMASALRRSFAKKSGKAMLHLVTAWASESGLTLGQVACEEKSNEITAIPELLKLLKPQGLHGDDRCDGHAERDRRTDSQAERALRAGTQGEPVRSGEGDAATVRSGDANGLRRHEARGA
ncbi:MAG: ISAs1 family transposase [Planctomycetaceae bacterium]